MRDYQEDIDASERFIIENQFDAALKFFARRIEEFGKDEPDKFIFLRLLYAKHLILVGKTFGALEVLEAYELEESQLLNDKVDNYAFLKGELHHWLGVAYYRAGKYLDAQKNLEASIELKKNKKGEPKVELAKSCLAMSRVLTNIGDYDQALLYIFRVILPLYSTDYSKNNYRLAIAFIQMGRVYRLKEELKQSAWSLQQAEKILIKMGLKSNHVIYADLFNNQGLHFWKEGKIKEKEEKEEAKRYWYKAKKVLEKGIEIAYKTFIKSTIAHPEIATLRADLAVIHTSLEEVELAHENYDRGIKILKDIYPVSHPEIGRIHNDKGYLYRVDGKYELALKNYQSAIYAVVNGFKEDDIAIYHRNPKIELTRIDSFRVLILSLSRKADLQLRWFEKESALEHLEQARRTLETLFELLQKVSKYFFSVGTKFSFEKHARRFCELMLRLTAHELDEELGVRAKVIEFAYDVSEFTRTVSLLEDFREHQILRAKIKGATRTEYIRLQREIEKLFKTKVTTKARPNSNVKADIFRIQQKFENWILEWKKINQESLQFQVKDTSKEPELRTATAKDLRASMYDGKTGLVSYFTGLKATYVFVVTKNFVEFKAISGKENNKALMTEAREMKTILQITEGDNFKSKRKEFIDLGTQLYQKLFAPLEDFLQGIDRICILPDGELVGLPFEVLLYKPSPPETPFKDLNYLLHKDFTIGYHYSATILNKVYMDSPSNPTMVQNKFLGIAPVKFDSLKDLKKSGDAVNRVADLFKEKYPNRVSVLTRKKATLQQYKSEAKNSRIIHFVSHISHSSCIHLWGKGKSGELWLEEVISVAPLVADLVFLCGCTSGVVRSKVDSSSLDRAFLTANANNIVCTIYDIIDSSPTHDLVFEFYKNVLNGETYSQGLKLAKKAALKKPHHELPIYWSGFLFVGDHEAKL